ncbi:MAG: hypothetical protein MUP22_04880, partial [Desulfobacterales bacterium]|nr:hypothetical protein [Desulfobacterales bacterium]
YYYNWHHERFYGEKTAVAHRQMGRGNGGSRFLSVVLKTMDKTLKILRPLIWLTAVLLMPLANVANPFMRAILPVMEPIYLGLVKLLSPIGEKLGNRFVKAVVNSDPAMFEP